MMPGEIIISLGEAVNALKRGSVEVIKHDAEDDRLLQGAVFVLCTDEGLKNEIMERKSGADGKVVFDDLEYGDYWIVEKRAPYGLCARSKAVSCEDRRGIMRSCAFMWTMKRS